MVEYSLNVNESVAELPATRLDRLEITATVGGVVSATTVLINKVTVLLASAPSALALPAASVNTPLATLTTPLELLLAVGVKMAV